MLWLLIIQPHFTGPNSRERKSSEGAGGEALLLNDTCEGPRNPGTGLYFQVLKVHFV
jgi:hypothetical protein